MKIETITSPELLTRFGHGHEIHSLKISRNFLVISDDQGNSLVYDEDSIPAGEVVWLVLQNADFTEGRGPMRAHKLFKRWEDGLHYILAQDGIMGGTQRITNMVGVSIKGNAYCVSTCNGYDLEPMILN